MKFILLFLFLISLISGCGSNFFRHDDNFSYTSLPKLKTLDRSKNYILRLTRVNDPRLPDLSEAQYLKLYSLIEKTAKEYVGFNVKIIPQAKVDVLQFFKNNELFLNTQAAKKTVNQQYIDFATEKGKLITKLTILNAVKSLGNNIKHYIPSEYAQNISGAVDYLYNVFERKYHEIRKIKLSNGTFFQDEYALTQSYVHWTIILPRLTETDFIVTNTMIAGADNTMPIYVILRGGITSGFVEGNFHNAPYHAAGIVGLFQFLSTAPFFIRERGIIPKEVLLPLIAMMFGHEFGHFFARYKEMYVPEAGIHMTSTGLDYLNWFKRVTSMKNKHPIYGIEQLTNY